MSAFGWDDSDADADDNENARAPSTTGDSLADTPSWVSATPPDRMYTAQQDAPASSLSDQGTSTDWPSMPSSASNVTLQPRPPSLYGGLPIGDPYPSDEDGRWKQPMRDPATGITGEVDVLHAGFSRIDRGSGTIYADSSQGPIPIGTDEPAAALARIVRDRGDSGDDSDDDGDIDAGNDGGDANDGDSGLSELEKGRARLSQIQAQMQSYGGFPQRLETMTAAMQARLRDADSDDPGNQPARQGLARLQSTLAQWKQDHPEYNALNREQSDLQASVQAQQEAQDQSDAQIKASLAMPETVRMNGALPSDSMPALGSGDVSLADIQQRAGDLAGQMQIAPSTALRAALIEAKNGGATTVGGVDISEAIRNAPPAPLPSTDPATLRGANPSIFHADQWDLPAMAQDAWGRAKDFGAALEQGLARPITGVLGAVAVGNHLLTGTPLNDTGAKQFADAINDYWSEARNPGSADSALSKVTGSAAPIIPTLIVERFGGSLAGEIFNALSMGGEAMLDAKEKGWSDDAAMEMFTLNTGFGAFGGRMISRFLNRINTLTGGAFSKYILALAKDNLPALAQAAGAGLSIGEKALEGGLFGAVQTFGSEAWAKLRNLGGSGQREWSDIWNDAKTAGVQNALTMALTGIFAAGAVPRAQRQQIAEQGKSEAPSPMPTSPPEPLASSPANRTARENFQPAGEESEPSAQNSEPAPAKPAAMENDSSTIPGIPDESARNPLAQRVADLHDEAADLRGKIASAHETGTPEAIGELGRHLDAEKETQAQFHEATQDYLDSVPEDIRNRINRAVGPGLDYDAIRARNREDPTHSFATAEIGNALRDEYVSKTTQRAIRKMAEVNGVDPALADRLADQTIGARAVRDLGEVLRRKTIDRGKARILKKLGLVKRAQYSDGTRRLAITADALPLLPKPMQDAVTQNPKIFRVVHPKGPPADGLNRLVDGGRQRIADTARGVQTPAAFKKAPRAAPLKALLPAGAFEEHHIISDSNRATKDHPLLKLAGFDLQSAINKIWLPIDAASHPTKSIHRGRHLQRVSNNLAHSMNEAVRSGQEKGWTQKQYADALHEIISKERALLESGERALNKNARPNAQ